MRVAPKRILTAVMVIFWVLAPPVAFGQEEGNVLINTDPQGSLVELEGETTLSGVTPVKFTRNLSGTYQINVIRDGYEKYHSTAYFSVSQFSQIDIRLVPKTRFKSFIRSLIIPGWGQNYYGSKTKAFLFAFGTLASAVGYAFAWDDYDSKKDDYEARKSAFDNATQWGDLPRLQAELQDAQQRADDAEDIVNVVRVVTISIYALNLLDSFLFFPDFSSYTEYKVITAAPDFGTDRVGLTLSLNF